MMNAEEEARSALEQRGQKRTNIPEQSCLFYSSMWKNEEVDAYSRSRINGHEPVKRRQTHEQAVIL